MATQNGIPGNTWTLVINAAVAMKGGVSCQYTDIEIATTDNATAPAESIEGHFVHARKTEPVELSAGARLWWRNAPKRSGTSDGTPVGVYTLSNV